MKKRILFILAAIVSQSIWCQKFPGNTVLQGSDIEFRTFTKYYPHANGCNRQLEVRFITPTMRKDKNSDVNTSIGIGPGSATSIGSAYLVSLYDSSNKFIESKKILPSNFTDKNKINWYRYITSFTHFEKGVSYYVRVSLVNYFYVSLNFGGYFQEPTILPTRKASAINPSRIVCRGSVNTGEKVNLTIPNLIVTNGNGKQYLPLLGETPLLRRGQSFEIKADIKNNGNKGSKATDLRLFVGSSSSINSASQFAILSVPALSQNASRTIYLDQPATSSDLIGSFKLSPGKTYYMFVKVDEDNINSGESNEKDNLKQFKFTYSGLSGKYGNKLQAKIGGFSLHTKTNAPYLMEVFDFAGQKILSKEVKNLMEENEILGSLPEKLYIIKSKSGDRKIYNSN